VTHSFAAFLLTLGLAPSAPAPTADPLPKVPDGFKVELVLQAPDIEAPTALCVAPNGDVYIAEDPMDMSGPPTKNLDRIWLLKGGDPKRKVLFAEHMWAVMGLEVAGDKLFVVHAPHVTVFTLDAEGKAKERKELFSDLGPPVPGVPSFNDHIPSGIRMGMDGWLYVSIGDKGIPNMTRKEKDKGSTHVAEGRERRTKEGNHISLEGGGVIRFRPDGSGLEVFASGTRNHLDVPMDEQDRIFVRDNTDDGDGWNTRLMHLINGGFYGYPWAFKQQPAEALPMIHDFGGGSPCGGWVYCDDGLPETYRGRIFHCEWGKGQVLAVKVEPDGAAFKVVDEIKFMDPAGTGVKDFRPFTLRPTADGRGFYVTDWGFSGWLSKVKAGRLWKVTYVKDDVKPQPRGSETDAIDKLIKALDHPAHSERLRAQRLLTTKGAEALDALAKNLTEGKLALVGQRHALWVLRELGWMKWPETALKMTEEQDDPLIYNAIRVLGSYDVNEAGANAKTSFLIASELITIIDNDDHAPNRLQAAIAMTKVATPKWCKDVVQELGVQKDPWVRLAMVRTLKRSADWAAVGPTLPVKNFDKWEPGARDGLFAALTEEYDTGAVAILQKLAARPEPETRQRALGALSRVHHDRKPYAGTWWGTQPEKQKPPPRVVEWEGTPLVREALLKGLADKEASVRKAAVNGLLAMNDPATLAPLTRQFSEESDVETRTDIVRAIGGLHSPQASEFLGTVLQESTNPEPLRLEAVAGLEMVSGPAAEERIAKVAVATEPVALQVRALEALGNSKAKQARTAGEALLPSPNALVRRAAVVALGHTGDGTAAPLLLPLLEDPDTAVRIAAVQALGALKVKTAVPALLQAAGKEATQFDAIAALAQMPDARALTAYLNGLGSKNAELRQACRQAIAAIRDEALPSLEKLVKGNEVRPELLPELRNIYLAHVPVLKWRLIGPFPGDGKAYPPETEQQFDAVYEGAEKKQVKWREQTGDAKGYGKVNLAKLYQPNTDVVAYGYAEVEAAAARDAQLQIGSDDTIVVWLNGKKVHEFQGDRGWNHDQDKVNVQLEKGKNTLLIKCGNHAGPWEFSVAVSGEGEKFAFLQGGAQKFDLEAFRAFARKERGDAERGGRLFSDLKGLACVKCHAVAGQGGQVGPDLAGIGLKYQREELMTAILEPSKVIAQGYETMVLTTTKGTTLTGVFKGETADVVNLMDAEGKAHVVAKKDIEDRSISPVSTMPNGLNEGMTLQDFTDLVAFLEARREETTPPKK
jgi:putative membrane-bound dehydrogenase-like protein